MIEYESCCALAAGYGAVAGRASRKAGNAVCVVRRCVKLREVSCWNRSKAGVVEEEESARTSITATHNSWSGTSSATRVALHAVSSV